MPLPRRPLLPLAAAALLALAAGCGAPAEPEDGPEPGRCGGSPASAAPDGAVPGDMDGDGREDLVASFGSTALSGASEEPTGYIAAVPGGPDGPDAERTWTLRAGEDGLPGLSGGGSAFGGGALLGDFDGDGYTDIAAAGGPESGAEDALDVPVLLWGGEGGPDGGARIPLEESARPSAVGDFDGDGTSDLLVQRGSYSGPEGSVLYGPFDRDGAPAAERDGAPASTGGIDYSFITGDLTGDGCDEVIGFGSFEEMAYDTQVWLASEQGLTEGPALTTADAGVVADVDGDGRGDLVVRDIGSTVEDAPWEESTVLVFPGGPDGPAEKPSAELTLDSPGIPLDADVSDQFGAVLAAGDVDGDGRADIAASVNRPAGGDPAMVDRADVILLRGGPDGLTGEDSELLRPEDAGAPAPAGADQDDPLYDAYSEIPRTGLRFLDADGDGSDEIAATTPLTDSEGYRERPGPIWFFRPGGDGGDGGGAAPAPLAPEDLGSPDRGGHLATG
ncbi:FG-GAP repeat domain-containing protein [Nocardiopsis potens]|uniref:FG-GAP repeat domain-containing protein n=1 Tax=Nocardiopsis potens TaxID=1246458 RepID=UPI0003451EE4|nr:VCBS repeat-containing protein [Nocardiopsis potens]